MKNLVNRWYWMLGFALVQVVVFAQTEDGEVDGAESLWQGGRASVALDQEGLAAVDKLMADYTGEGKVAGMVVSIAYRGDVVYTKAAGVRGAEDDRPLKEDDLFRIYSMSKPVTGVAMMQLEEQGKFELDDALGAHLNDLADLKVHNPEGEPTVPKQTITMRHLLTHTAGFGYVFANNPVANRIRSEVFTSTNLEEMATRVADIPLIYEPGTRWHYSIAVDVQGLVVERLSGKTFDVYLNDHIFAPLGMQDTFFSVPEEKFDRLLPNHTWSRQMNHLIQMGQNSFDEYRDVTFFSGGGGLVSTAQDYMTFAQAVANGGELNGVRILDEATVENMRQDHLGKAIVREGGTGENPERRGNRGGFGFGLGFGVNTAPSTANRSQGEYNWGGAAGTVFWIDPIEDLIVVGMIQLMGSPWPLGRDLHTAVRSALVYE
ncbi:MAG: beta-lactamase family protein [Gammaproteobacteria bacterium]|nr:beta-lactamase family protein [Gammaproteobacteria bacterium]